MQKRRRLLLIAAVSALCIGLLLVLTNKALDQTGPTAIQKFDIQGLDRKFKSALPLGTPLSAVQSYLNQPGVHTSFDQATHAEFAVIRNIRGSSFLIERSVCFYFTFDDNLNLRSITNKEELTGP